MKIFSSVLFLMLSLSLAAQPERFKKGGGSSEEQQEEEEKKEQKKKTGEVNFFDRLVFGGGLGLSFGTTATQIMLSPQVGYKFSDKLVAGPGFVYNYLKVDQVFNPASGRMENVDFENVIYGPSAFVTYFPFKKAFVGAQLEVLNHDYYFFNSNISNNLLSENMWTPVLFLQGGYSVPLGNKGFAQLGLRINVLHKTTSPYSSWWAPIITAYF